MKIDLADQLQKLLAHYEIEPTKWDALLVCDGSGTTWAKTCGWATVLMRKTAVVPELFHGSFSHGTNNVAEMLGVLHPTLYLTATESALTQQRGYHVHVISDSEYVVSGLMNEDAPWAWNVDKNKELWLAFVGARRQGLVLHPYHIDRNSTELHQLCHDLANVARKGANNVQGASVKYLDSSRKNDVSSSTGNGQLGA